MAYAKRSRYSRRRPARRSRRRTNTLRKRSTYRRRTIRTPRSRKQIVNLTSEKKSDTRVFFSNVAAPANPPTFNAPVLVGGTSYFFVHTPTAMDKSASGTSHDLGQYRDRSDVYMKGYYEYLRFTANGGVSWMWRRICFATRGTTITRLTTAATPLNLESASNGWVRTWVNHNATAVGGAVTNALFKGTQSIDWVDPFTASVDTAKVDLKYDKFRVLHAGSSDNTVYQHKHWHPMNKNFYYNDEENGQGEVEGIYHEEAKRGMGDYYIVDIFQCANTNAANICQIDGTGRLYWHER